MWCKRPKEGESVRRGKGGGKVPEKREGLEISNYRHTEAEPRVEGDVIKGYIIVEEDIKFYDGHTTIEGFKYMLSLERLVVWTYRPMDELR